MVRTNRCARVTHARRAISMKKKFPDLPKHPERTCWGCDRYCAASAMLCGNGSERTQHPVELFGEDWRDWGKSPTSAPTAEAQRPPGIVSLE